MIARDNPEAILVVLPADHFIADEGAFRAVLARAIAAAEQGWLTTIGVVPTRAETGYGYIELGRPARRRRPRRHALRREARPRAGRRLPRRRPPPLERGHVRLPGARDARVHPPPPARARRPASRPLDAAAERGDEAQALAEVFPDLAQSISIDHGVMEKADRVAVVPGSFGWNDVGSWEVAWELARHDVARQRAPRGHGHGRRGEQPGEGPLAPARRRRFALLGVSDLVVVETDDAVLVMPRSRAQDVRAVVEELSRRGGGGEL